MDADGTTVIRAPDKDSTASQGHEESGDQDVDTDNPRASVDAADADRRSGDPPGGGHAAGQTGHVHARGSEREIDYDNVEDNYDYGENDSAYADYTRRGGMAADTWTRASRPEWAHRISGEWGTWDLFQHPEMIADVTPYMDPKEAGQLFEVEKRPRPKSTVLMPGGKSLTVDAGTRVKDNKELYRFYKVIAADIPGKLTWTLSPEGHCFKGGRVYKAIPYEERCGLIDDSVRTNAINLWGKLGKWKEE